MAALPNVEGMDKPIDAYVSDALHFRRGIRAYLTWYDNVNILSLIPRNVFSFLQRTSEFGTPNGRYRFLLKAANAIIISSSVLGVFSCTRIADWSV
jgi:hypothetical protein